MYELDRRTAIKWVLGASAALRLPSASFDALAAAPVAQGYGKDPNLMKIYKAGELWPLTLSKEQRVTAAALCDLIIPADDTSPAASSVGVVDFLDEWISAPYPEHAEDRKLIVDALSQVESEAQRRFKTSFAKLSAQQMSTIADAIVTEQNFARYRALTAGGFYTTPVGVKDLKYVGNVAMQSFDGPTPEILKKLGLA
jgi:gluconate 2-dehydrogenase subunit 3-like protein